MRGEFTVQISKVNYRVSWEKCGGGRLVVKSQPAAPDRSTERYMRMLALDEIAERHEYSTAGN